jgi:hypothetical protein
MMVRSLLIIAVFFGLPITILGQTPQFSILGDTSKEWMVEYHRDILKSMKLRYSKPGLFRESPGTECFKAFPKLSLIITCAGNQLHSADDEFVAFIPVYRILTKQDSIDIKKMFPDALLEGLDQVHVNQIKGNIRYAFGDSAARNWKNHVTYYSPIDARNKFNADTAISFSLPLNANDYYQGKYNHLDALFLQKQGRGFICLYCFYTDKARKDLANYWKAIEGTFRYED